MWFARLADAQTGDAVPAAVAAAIGVQQQADNPTAVIAHALADRPGVLILDNCEHVVGAAATLVLALLAASSQLRILSTGRSHLAVADEQVMPVDPLPVRHADGSPGAAVQLLYDRVRAGRPQWTPTTSDRDAADRICTSLDGLPLGIELAAARERAFGLDGIAEHLDRGLELLGKPAHGSVTPHASLTSAIGWSIDRLDPVDRAQLVRLWPFEGGFSSQAAQAVTPDGDGTGQTGKATLSALASLVDRSMIKAEIVDGHARYRMLETIRRHCQQIDPDEAASREAHAGWVRAMVAGHAGSLEGPRAAPAIAALRTELPNIRAGVRHDLEHRPLEALRTVSRLDQAWVLLGNQPEGMRLIRAALDSCPDVPVEDRVCGLLALSFGSSHGGSPQAAIELAESALALLGKPTDAVRGALYFRALHFRGAAVMDLGDVDLARETLEEIRDALGRLPTPPHAYALYLLGVGMLQLMQGRPDAADTLGRARQAAIECGSMWVEGLADFVLALGLLRSAEHDRSQVRTSLVLLGRALTVFERQTNTCDMLTVIYHGAHALAVLDQPAEAARLRAAVLRQATRTGTNPRRYAHLAGAEAEDRMARLRQTHDAERAGAEPLSWTEMIALFTDTAALVTRPAQRASPGVPAAPAYG